MTARERDREKNMNKLSHHIAPWLGSIFMDIVMLQRKWMCVGWLQELRVKER